MELLSPAGDFETALAAFGAGADAVYCGLAEFSARAFAKNFTEAELGGLVAYARAKGRRVYVTFNTLLDEDDVPRAVETLARLEEIGPDALIVQDLGVARICRENFPGLALHASTQLVAHNLEGVLALRDLGFSRAVLARELSLAEIASIAKRCGGMELECFVHGALCYSVSGLCLFSAMEKDRSGNRGRCAYCCRAAHGGRYPFSMKDLRLGEDARRLADCGVASAKIEGRMKSPLYVACATAYYRGVLDGTCRDLAAVEQDLETVFSRRTTPLYLDGPRDDVIDPESIGHLGARVGVVKRVAKDRDGSSWLRFRTTRALEKHDGLQFAAPAGERMPGFGISAMRRAISRSVVFEVEAGTDVEVLLPDDGATDWRAVARPGDAVYCSMSNAVKRRFRAPSFRPADFPAGTAVDVEVHMSEDRISAKSAFGGSEATASVAGTFGPANAPDKTYGAVEKAFSRLGDTGFRLGRLSLVDPSRLFAPPGVLNELRRDLVAALADARDASRRAKVEWALDSVSQVPPPPSPPPARSAKIRAGQQVPPGEWDEVVVAIDAGTRPEDLAGAGLAPSDAVRLAPPVFTPEPGFGALRVAVKRFVRAGYARWEASDLATLRMLKAVGVEDVSADWTLYAFNSAALAELSALGARWFVASPENGRSNLAYLRESGYGVAFLLRQSTPLFISLTKPAADKVDGLSIFRRGILWVTTRPAPRTFDVPSGAPSRVDTSWDPT